MIMKTRIPPFFGACKSIPVSLAVIGEIVTLTGCASKSPKCLAEQPPETQLTLQSQLDEQTKRIDRLYRALGPFLDVFEQQWRQVEERKQKAKHWESLGAANSAMAEGRYPEALALLEQEFQAEQKELGPTNATTLRTLRRLMDWSGATGDWVRSAKYAKQLMEVSGPDVLAERSFAVASLLAGDEPGYRDVCKRMVAEHGETEEAGVADRTAKTCLLAPHSVSDLEPARRLADLAVKLEPDTPWFQLVKGMSEYRSGNTKDAIRWMDGLRTHDDPRIAALAGFFVAMAEADAGNADKANAAFEAANKRLNEDLQTGQLGSRAGEQWWFDSAAAIVVRAEAERKIFGAETSPRPTPASLAAARRSRQTVNDILGCQYTPELIRTNAWKASWSPDNKRIVFTKQSGGIAILDLVSQQTTDLVPTGKDAAWSPDGKFIAYVTPGSEAYLSEVVWIVPAAGGNPTKVGDGGFPAWSADSSEVIFHSRKLNQILSAKVSALDEPPTVFYAKPLSWYPAISPDGSRIAFGIQGRLILIARATGETNASLATGAERGLLPCWSPDGRQVAFGGYAGSRAGLWIFDVERGGAFQVAKNPSCTMPAWSPDGEILAFDRRGNPSEIWQVKTKSLPREPALAKQLPVPPAQISSPRETPASLEGKPVPGPFKLTLLDGGELALPDPSHTNVLLLDFWATWCGPCRQVMPTLEKISQEYASRGVRYFAVNLREKPETIRSCLDKAGLKITVALDTDGKMAEAFQVRGIPTMVIVDRNNIIRKVHVGAAPNVGDELREVLDSLMPAKSLGESKPVRVQVPKPERGLEL